MEGKKIKLFMGIPSTGDRSDAQVYALRDIERKYGDRVEFVYPENMVARIFHDFARNEYVKDFLETDCDAIWFLDSDVVPPTKVMDLVAEHWDQWSCAGAPYPVFMSQVKEEGPIVVYTVYKKGQNGFHASQVPDAGQEMVDGLATGCLFIKREVFAKLEKPYFEFKYNPETREMTEGEDLGFCRKVNEQGFQFFVDYGMCCKHYKRVDLLDVNNYAVRFANNAVNAYDRYLRAGIARKKLESTPTKADKDAKAARSRIILP